MCSTIIIIVFWPPVVSQRERWQRGSYPPSIERNFRRLFFATLNNFPIFVRFLKLFLTLAPIVSPPKCCWTPVSAIAIYKTYYLPNNLAPKARLMRKFHLFCGAYIYWNTFPNSLNYFLLFLRCLGTYRCMDCRVLEFKVHSQFLFLVCSKSFYDHRVIE